jgi:hypothetical protein
MKKIKSIKTILEKNKKKHVGKYCSNPRCLKKKYKATFSTSSIKIIKKRKKKACKETL